MGKHLDGVFDNLGKIDSVREHILNLYGAFVTIGNDKIAKNLISYARALEYASQDIRRHTVAIIKRKD